MTDAAARMSVARPYDPHAPHVSAYCAELCRQIIALG
jgi:hypothetical protein